MTPEELIKLIGVTVSEAFCHQLEEKRKKTNVKGFASSCGPFYTRVDHVLNMRLTSAGQRLLS